MLHRILQRQGFRAVSTDGPAVTSPQEYIRMLEGKDFGHIVELPTAVDLAAT